ncbi:MAG TPA: diacylglycerol kinase family protein [Alphaproteobacteria bacterium]|nr:diacylglycerol kinase family protein [Alphaproteobacteria bacterium]
MRTKIIVNPAAGQGASARRWAGLREQLHARLTGDEIDEATSGGPGEETRIAREAALLGFEHFIVVGGDGTTCGVVNGLFEREQLINGRALLSVIPAGTGNDLTRSLGFGDDGLAAIEAAAARQVRYFDLLTLICMDRAGNPMQRYAINLVSWGAAAEITHRTNRSWLTKWLSGRFAYYLSTLLVTLSYPDLEGDLTVDGRTWERLVHYTGMVCNGEWAGGGMRLSPGARPDDGILDLVMFGDIRRREVLLQRPEWLYAGQHVEHPAVDTMRGRHIRIAGRSDTLVATDGDAVGRLPLSVKVLPQALPVTVAPA